MIVFKSITIKNFLSYGNVPTQFHLNKHPTTLIVGKNGQGKCVDKFTEIDVGFLDEETQLLFADFISLRKNCL